MSQSSGKYSRECQFETQPVVCSNCQANFGTEQCRLHVLKDQHDMEEQENQVKIYCDQICIES
jgi:hypothetical protein